MIYKITDKTVIIPSKRRFYFRAKIKDWKNLPDKLFNEINNIFKIGYKFADPIIDFQEFPISQTGIAKNELPMKINELENVTIFASTLGAHIDEKIKLLISENKTLQATLLDAWASESLETLNEYFNKIIEKDKKEISMRFSPGYGEYSVLENYNLDKNYLHNSIVKIDKKTGIIHPRKSTICLISWNK